MEPETDEVNCTVLGETPLAWLLGCNGVTGYFPKKEVSFARRNIKTGDAVAVIPVWLLAARGWDKPGTDSPLDGFDNLD